MSLTSSLQHIQSYMAEQGDLIHANKIGQLLEKLQRDKLVIAMCGHFSAGKSSIINAMCGANVLPSGPIPTSANLIMIESGTPEAIVKYRTGQAGLHREVTVPVERIDTYSKNGMEVESIDIRYPIPLLSDRLVFMDTPGVDSTDDAHRISTESALHLADVIFYVTDYNHVQSEVNFTFVKRLKDWGKPVYLIINQVDKHHEQELAFTTFKENVKNAFSEWGIQAEGYLFISVKQPDNTNSDWFKLLELCELIKQQADVILQASLILTGIYLVKEHVSYLYPDTIKEHSDSEQLETDFDIWSMDQVELQLQEFLQLREQVKQGPEQLKQRFRDDLARLVNNANIMPSSAREVAGTYLQSRKPGFRAGLLFSGTKTKAAIDARLQTLTGVVVDHTDKQLIWHLNDLLRSYAHFEVNTYPLQKVNIEIPSLTVNITPEWIASQVNMSSGFTDEYTMIFAGQLAEQIKSTYRKNAAELFEQIYSAYIHEAKRAEDELEVRIKKMTDIRNSWTDIQKREEEKNEYLTKLLQELDQSRDSMAIVYPDPESIVQGGHSHSSSVNASNTCIDQKRLTFSLSINNSNNEEKGPAGTNPDSFNYRSVMEQMADRLSKSAEQLEPVLSLSGMRLSLIEREKKLRDHQFTIALFGAFSAGKSSFANALIGESILPVSPNPTTAAINKIVPAADNWPHLTARVRMKAAASILADIQYSMNMLGENSDYDSLGAAVHAIRHLSMDRVSNSGKAHLSFLKAIAGGWDDIAGLIGTEWMAVSEQYRQYVSNESKSCFVESIDLHYSSAITDQGVILVDTPGADSIHARHTGVAFNYMKNADAIFFVTYYNHAFSQSDKQFLLQLGRVKDSFELDKMFFIINAADLANSLDELEEVIDYVRKELQRHGIRNPRIFPVSSRLALEARLTGDKESLHKSGLPAFERSFTEFAVKELAAAALRSAELELDRAVQCLRQMIQHSHLSAEQSHKQYEYRQSLFPIIKAEIESGLDQLVTSQIRQELNELLYYVKQRCGFRFGEWYNDSFHPSVLQDDGRNINTALVVAWKQLQQSASIEVSQEVLATSLRMERFIQEQLRRWNERLLHMVSNHTNDFITQEQIPGAFRTPEVGESLPEPDLDYRIIKKHFKGAKSFFESGGKEQLKAILESSLTTIVGTFVDEHNEQLGTYYEQLFIQEAQLIAAKLLEQFRLFTREMELNYNNGLTTLDLEDRLSRIEHYIA
jgi:GTPase Era involved in 16S rRNA processing